MKYVKKIIFRNKETYNRLYQGSELLFEVQKEVEWKGLTFTAIEPSTIQYTNSTVSTAQYSYDAINWETANNVTLNLNKGDKVYFRGNITGNQSDSNYANFSMSGKVAASGSLMSMQAGNPNDKSLKYKYEFFKLFQDCSSLVKAPELPATTLTERCYQNLFVSCGLTEPTALPATTLAVRCYQNLFNGCSNLTSAPELPATTMVDNCYANMFYGCSKLTTPPELPSTTLAEGCYQGMFYHSGLTTAPELPATTLAPTCYKHLFQGCTSLTTAPELNAETLVSNCYTNMFYGCSKLNYIKALFTTTPSSSYTANWVYGVASSGTFVKNKNATWSVTGINGVPTGWTIQSLVDWKGLTFTALEPSTIKYNPYFLSTAQYSYDTVNWNSADNVTLNLNKGDKVYFKGSITGNLSDRSFAYFAMTGKISASGSIMSMQDGNPQDKSLKYKYEFCHLFQSCTSLVTAPELPATTLSNSCYFGMFYNCTSLVKAPDLPATTLQSFCYREMFWKCSKLNYIRCYAKTYDAFSFSMWLEDVAPTGDFYCYDSSIFPTGDSGIPDGWTIHILDPKQYDELYVSGRYNFKIPKGDGTYYVIDTKNDCEVDIISDNNKSSLTGKIFTSNSQGDYYEWDLFFTGTKLYFDLSFKNNRRLSWTFGTLNANTKYTIGGSNGNYLGTDRALYFNGSKKASSTTKSTYNNTSDIAFIGENVTDFYVGNIKIYEKSGLVYHIVPIMYNGNVAFYDKVNKRFMEITSTPPSEYAKTRTTGEKVII